MKILELFAGSRSIGKAAQKLGMEVFSSDIQEFEDINYAVDILDFDVSRLPWTPDIIWASPPCTFFSVASIGHHWNRDHSPKSENAILGINIVSKTIEIIKFFEKQNPNLKWFFENPRGKLRKLNVVKDLPRVSVWYCQYNDTRAKPTDIWSNNIFSLFNPTGWVPREQCFNGNKKCHHEEAPRGSRTGTQGIKGDYNRSKIPNELCIEILKSCIC